MGKAYLNNNQMTDAIIMYYSQFTDNRLDVNYRICIFDDEINISFDLLEYEESEKLSSCKSKPLSKSDLEAATAYYLQNEYDEDFDGTCILKGVDYHMDCDAVFMDGIRFGTKKKSHSRKLVKR